MSKLFWFGSPATDSIFCSARVKTKYAVDLRWSQDLLEAARERDEYRARVALASMTDEQRAALDAQHAADMAAIEADLASMRKCKSCGKPMFGGCSDCWDDGVES